MRTVVCYGELGPAVPAFVNISQPGLSDQAKLTSMLTKQTPISMNEKA